MQAGQSLDAETETSLIVRAVCATKLPTLTFTDNKRFRELLADLFPGMTITDNVDPDLQVGVYRVLRGDGRKAGRL
jgi:hypothetical protein